MIEQQGKVIRQVGDSVEIQIGATTGCPACDAGNGCGAGVFGRLLKRNPIVFEVFNSIDATAGQAVSLGIPEREFLRLVWRLYSLPLIAALAGMAIGHYLGLRAGLDTGALDLLAVGGAAVFFMVALFTVKRLPQRRAGEVQVQLLNAGGQTGSQVCGAPRSRSLE